MHGMGELAGNQVCEKKPRTSIRARSIVRVPALLLTCFGCLSRNPGAPTLKTRLDLRSVEIGLGLSNEGATSQVRFFQVFFCFMTLDMSDEGTC